LNVLNRATNSSHFLYLVASIRFHTSGAKLSRTWLQSQHSWARYLCARPLDHPPSARHDHPIVSSSLRQSRVCRIDTCVQYPAESAPQESQACIRNHPRIILRVNDTENESFTVVGELLCLEETVSEMGEERVFGFLRNGCRAVCSFERHLCKNSQGRLCLMVVIHTTVVGSLLGG